MTLAVPELVVFAFGGQTRQNTVPAAGWYWPVAHSEQFLESLSRDILPAGHAEQMSAGSLFPEMSSRLIYLPPNPSIMVFGLMLREKRGSRLHPTNPC